MATATTNDLRRLLKFLDDLHTLMIHAFERRDEIMPVYLHEPLARIRETYATRMDELRREVRQTSRAQRTALAANGLAGPELDVKLAGFYANFDQFQATRNDNRRRPRRGLFRWLPPLKGSLDWADIILGSLAAIFGGKDAVEEIKKVIEKGIRDGEGREFSYGSVLFPYKNG